MWWCGTAKPGAFIDLTCGSLCESEEPNHGKNVLLYAGPYSFAGCLGAPEPVGCIACDQFTSDRDYWAKAEEAAAGGPSTLRLILPEIYLGEANRQARVDQIHKTMEQYDREVLTRAVDGFVYVERTLQSGRVRQGLVGRVDLEAYNYHLGSLSLVRPSEHTVEDRIPPRMAVRRGARLETPHVMMLADDPGRLLVEPVGRQKEKLRPLYDGELMLGGGHVAGWAVEDPALIQQIEEAMEVLSSQETFQAKYPGAPNNRPLALAVGDGNHSLATAKAYWEELKKTLTPEQQKDHPARWCLAEVCNPVGRGGNRADPPGAVQHQLRHGAAEPDYMERRELCRDPVWGQF